MTTTRRTLLRATAGLALVAPTIVRAQAAWPNKPITIVVNFPAGGLTDGIARAFAQHVQQATGQQVIIDNKPGAGGNIGAAQVSRAPADGYTFLHSVSSTLIQNRVMFKTLGFDPDKDLTIISGTSSGVPPVKGCAETSSRPLAKSKPTAFIISSPSARCVSIANGPCSGKGCGRDA